MKYYLYSNTKKCTVDWTLLLWYIRELRPSSSDNFVESIEASDVAVGR